MFKEGNEPQKDESMRQRVENLRESDNKYEDSVYDLAKREDEIREKLEKTGIGKKDVSELADIFSTKDLERVEAEKEKWIDDLTGLKNKNAYREEIPQLLKIEKRQENNCSLMVIDFDHFKEVNDKYGHDVGDVVLKKIAEVFKETVRKSDIVYRFGGEEFVIFLPTTAASGAEKLAEKIRSKIEESIIKANDAKGKKIELKRTISIGCVGTDQLREWGEPALNNPDEFLAKMFKAADLSASASKENGRNQVTLFSEDLLKE